MAPAKVGAEWARDDRRETTGDRNLGEKVEGNHWVPSAESPPYVAADYSPLSTAA